MYPSTFFGLFPPFPKDQRAFVAISFSASFLPRWTNVIDPGIRSVRVNDVPLDPHRVDMRMASDSVLTEILDGIARCRIFIADISVIGHTGDLPVRNANVLYEVGLAHATRLPEEVILFRSDDEPLLFDMANIRVVPYNPDNAPDTARLQVSDAIVQALREVDLKKSLAVRRLAESLDYHSWTLLIEANATEGIRQPGSRTMGEVLGGAPRVQAIARLLEAGALRSELALVTPEFLARAAQEPQENLLVYRVTEFGAAVAQFGMKQLGGEVATPHGGAA